MQGGLMTAPIEAIMIRPLQLENRHQRPSNLPSLLLFIRLFQVRSPDEQERIHRLGQHRGGNNCQTPKRPNILPVLGNIQVPPEEHAVRRQAADIPQEPADIITRPHNFKHGRGVKHTTSQSNAPAATDSSATNNSKPSQQAAAG